MSHAEVLHVQDLHFAYKNDGPSAIDGLTLQLHSGKVAAILGPNGAGKTTLLLLVLGLLKPTSGSIMLLDRDLMSYHTAERSRLIALVPQSEQIPFAYTSEEYVLLGRTPHLKFLGVPGERDWAGVEQLLGDLELLHLCHRPLQELSGGEQQMIFLARALAQEPRLLLMDEPFAHLDLGNRDRILTVMRRLAARGVSVLFTSHDPDAAASVAEHIVLMREGRALAAGTSGETFTAELLRDTYGVPLRVVHFEGRPVVLLEART